MSALSDPRHTFRELFAQVMAELDVRRALDRKREEVLGWLGDGDAERRHTRLIAFGKAAAPMTQWLIEEAGIRVNGGVLSAPHSVRGWTGVTAFRGGHPVPNLGSLRAGAAALEVARAATADEDVIYLISGGGSALFEAPVHPTIGLEDFQELNATLVSCGADIVDMNVVRKHLSAVKGGRLAQTAFPARQLTLYISDVPEGQDSSVASGPTMPDDSTLERLGRIVSAYALEGRLPASVRTLVDAGTLPETPKPGDPCFTASTWICVLENRHAIDAAEAIARRSGWETAIDTSVDDLDVGVAAERLLARLRVLRGAAGDRAACVVSGGELSSRVLGDGVGGRNQAFVLECVERIAGERIAVLSAGTDGIDGNSPAAGAVADGSTRERASSLGMNPADYIARSDSHSFFKRLGDDIICGATQNNVRDLRVLVSW